MRKKIITNTFHLLVLLSLIALPNVAPAAAQSSASIARLVRALELDEANVSHPTGLLYTPASDAFHIIEAPQLGQSQTTETEIIALSTFSEQLGVSKVPISVINPLNMAVDSKRGRLLIWKSEANQLLELPISQSGSFQPAPLIRNDAQRFGLQDPQGMTVDPNSGELFILDQANMQIVGIMPGVDGSFKSAEIRLLNLKPSAMTLPSGIALNPSNGHLYVYDNSDQSLHELNQSSEILAVRDLSTFGIVNLQGMVFAPSGDQTDDPGKMHLFLADSGLPNGKPVSAKSTNGLSIGTSLISTDTTSGSNGQILEVSFTAMTPTAASTFTSSLVRVTDMSAISPPSPDPSGITYVPTSDTLMIDDGEVEETVDGITHFQGANVWELTRLGSLVSTANVSKIAPTQVPMTNEPTGIAWNPTNGHYYISDDNGKYIYDLDVGSDGQIGTSDDTWTRFDTMGIGSGDPEGVTYDSWDNRLFVADGVNMEVYQFTLAGQLLSHFDVEQYGVADPESVEFNPDTGTLFVMSSNKSSPVIVETDTSGNLLQTIDISPASIRTAAGLAYAPASDDSGRKNFFIVDRGIDNNYDPNIIDGKMYELIAPAASAPSNTAPVANDDSYAGNEDAALNVPAPGVLANDSDADGDPLSAILVAGVSNGSLSLNADGSFIYTPSTGFSGSDSFSYQASDGITASNTAVVTINITSTSTIIDILANGEASTAGTVSGDFTLTQADDGATEAITEQESGGKPATRYSYLEHKWTFNITSGNVLTFYANAWRSASNDGDSFIFAYSADDVNYIDMFTIDSTSDGTALSSILPPSLQGTIYIRATDSDHLSGHRSLDTLYVDQLYIHSEAQVGSPPAAPSELSAAVSAGEISLTWTDNATDEEGFYIQRSEDGSKWVLIDTVGVNGTAYSDPTVVPSTTYSYRVSAYNVAGASGYSNTSTVTTPAGLNLTGTGYKVQGVQMVDLAWNGGNAASFDIYRDGNLILSDVSGSAYTDNIGLKGSGTYEYQVCEARSTTNCSNTIQIIF